MEEQLAQVLANTQSSQDGPRRRAELGLKEARKNPDFAISLARIGVHTSMPGDIRQAALSTLRRFIEANWTDDDDTTDDDAPAEFPIPDLAKDQLRAILLELALSPEEETKVKASASYCVSKIAISDFPDNWPMLLPTVLAVLPSGTDAQVRGSLKVLHSLVEESLTEAQFFPMARTIIKACYDVALREDRLAQHRALAVVVFRSCFDLMDTVKDAHRKEVTAFADENLNDWLPFFETVLKAPLPDVPVHGLVTEQPREWHGPIALKTQVVKTLIKIKDVFPSLLLPQSLAFFKATWDELIKLQNAYNVITIESGTQSRMEDADFLPYTLDFLVLDELDFLNLCLRAKPVQEQLEAAMAACGGAHVTPWLLDLMKMLAVYSQVSQEEEGMWEIDSCLYLAEETQISSNYTARTASGDLLIKLGEWLGGRALEGLFAYTKTVFTGDAPSWRLQEAALYLFNALLCDFQEMDKDVSEPVSAAYLELVQYAINRQDQALLRARGFLVAGGLAHNLPRAAQLVDRTIESITRDESELVQVACVKAIEGFMAAPGMPPDRQAAVILAVQEFLEAQDMDDFKNGDTDDLLVTVLETLRSTIRQDLRIAAAPESKALDLLFLVAKAGSSNLQVTMIVNEAIDDIVSNVADANMYAAVCAKILPLLTGSIDVATVTHDDTLKTMAMEIMSVLVEHGSEPLPPGFAAAVLPKVAHLLMTETEGEVLRPGAQAVRYMLMHDHIQVFEWHDEQNRSGLEVCLMIIDRLLSTNLEDNAASEVGGLAAELVEKAGQERLGPYLLQLLQAVANRLDTAQAPAFIQSLILVFARLSLQGAQDVVQFLSDIQVNHKIGLEVVMSKWLENSVNFAGYDEIRQNVIALSKLYSLGDQRLAQIQVRGDLIMTNSNQILTRSRAKQRMRDFSDFALLNSRIFSSSPFPPPPPPLQFHLPHKPPSVDAALAPSQADPDQYTIVPAQLKIIKVLIEELLSASGIGAAINPASAAASTGLKGTGGGGGDGTADLDSDDDDAADDDGWEDEPNDMLDLALGSTIKDLMRTDSAAAGGSRQRDDETQAYLVEFFTRAAKENLSGFTDVWFPMLTGEEKRKLQEAASGQA